MPDFSTAYAGAPAETLFACEQPIKNQDRNFSSLPNNKLALAKGKPASGTKPHRTTGPGDKLGVHANAEKILRAFNTWSFKREQPSDSQSMLRQISIAIEEQAPVPFVLYWGKGPRDKSGTAEVQCLDFLAAMASRIRGVYQQGAAIKLLLTDTHAELNGHPADAIQRYFDDITSLAAPYGIETCRLAPLVKAAGNLAMAAPLEDIVTPETLSKLTASAMKWYRGSKTAEEGALIYLRMNLIEQRVVERAFPLSIFITFNGSELRCLFPKQLPIFYMYSLRRGVAVKPWFLPDEPSRCDLGGEAAQKNPSTV